MRGTFGDFSRSISLLATLTVTGLLTIAAGANLRFAGGIANGMLFLDGSKNASSTSRILVDGNTGSVSSTSFSATAGAASTPSYNFGGANDADSGIYRDTTGSVSISADTLRLLTVRTNGVFLGASSAAVQPFNDNTTDVGISGNRFNDGWFGGAVTSTHLDVNLGTTATTTMKLGDTDTPGCIIIGDNDRGGVTYLTALNGTIIGSTTDCR